MHLAKRIRGNKAYYYAIEKQRIDGKVKTTKQIYLGTARSITDRLIEKTHSLVNTKTFGSIALLLYIERLYSLESLFNESLDKKRKNHVSGKYFLSAVFNRILYPRSKAGIDSWLKTTYLDWYWKISTSSQKFWNHLEYIDDIAITIISDKIAKKTFELTKDNEFLWDTTNHFTYMKDKDSSVIAKGKSKQGRHEKNLICHGLLTGKESRMPFRIFPFKYMHDSKIFNERINDIVDFLKSYRKGDFTLIIDKGNNSKDNMKSLAKYKFIGSLRKEQAKDLLSVPLNDYQYKYKTPKGREVSVYDAGRVPMYGSEYRVVVSYEIGSQDMQKKRFEEKIRGTFKEFERIKDKKYKTNMSAMNALNRILPRKYLRVFERGIVKEGSKWRIELSENNSERKAYEQSFGKTILFTNRFDTPAIDIVKSYRSLIVVEDQFKALHNSFMIPISPVYEWTDQNIKAHVFLCFIALVVVRALELEARDKGLNMTFSRLLEEAEGIRIGMIADGRKVSYCFERTTPLQQSIMNAFGLHEFFIF